MIPHIPHEELLFLEDPRTTNRNSKDAFGHNIVKKNPFGDPRGIAIPHEENEESFLLFLEE